jgi:hypothetical protein
MAFDFSKLLRGTLDYSPSQGVADQDMSWADIGGIDISPAPQPESLSPEQRAAANNLGGKDFGPNWASDWVAERDAKFAEQERLKEQDRQRLINLNKDPGPSPGPGWILKQNEDYTRSWARPELTFDYGGSGNPPELWGQWFRTPNRDWSGYVSDSAQWAENLPKLGFNGAVFDSESGGFTPEAQAAVDKLKTQGYDFLYNPSTHNNYNVTVTPEGTYKLNTEGTSFFEEIAPFLGLLAIPFTGGLSAALGGGLAGTIGANALIQGGIAGLAGQDPLKAAIRGGVTAGIGSVVNPIASSIGADVLNATDSKFLSDIVSGAVKGVPGALMSGDASNLLTGAVTGAVGSQVGDQLGLTPKQSQVAMGIASKLLQGGDLSPSDIFRIGTSFGGKTPTASETAVGGGAETSGFFDAEEAQAVQDDIDSLLARYPDANQDVGTYYGVDPSQEKYADEDRLLAKYPAPEQVAEPKTSMDPMELNKFLEANIEDPGTIETLMQEYFPELYRQQIEVVGNRPPAELFPEFEQPLLTAEPTTPAPTPTAAPAPTPPSAPGPSAAPGPSPSPSPAPSPSTAQSGMDLSALFALLGMMNQDEDKPDSYQVAQINVPSPFGTVFDQQQNLLSMIGRG